MKPFTVSQTTVIQALAAGATVTSAAKLAEISRPTIYHWLQEPAFQQAVAFSKQEHALTMHDRLQTLTAKALDKLEALLDDPRSTPNVILKASLAILTRKNWTLPSQSIEDCAPAIHEAAERMEADETAAAKHRLRLLGGARDHVLHQHLVEGTAHVDRMQRARKLALIVHEPDALARSPH